MGDLFEIHPTKSYGMTNINLFSNNGKVPVVTNSAVSNGIGGWSDLKATEKGNRIVYSDTTTSNSIFYQPYDFIGYSHVQGLYPYTEKVWKENHLLYFVVAFRKSSFGKFNYGNKFTRDIALNMIVSLPITKSGKIDFDYMENYVQLIINKRLNELDLFMETNSFNNCELTENEQKCLVDLKDGRIKFEKYRIGDLFIGQTGDVDLQQKDINKKGTYFINSGTGNCGIKGKTDRKAKIFNSNTITVDFWGNAYYRQFDYKMATHNHVFSLSGDCIKNENIGLFIATQFSYMTKIFSHGNMGTWTQIQDMYILLPITHDNKIDYDFMENFILALKKTAMSPVKKIISFNDKTLKQLMTEK